MLASLPPHFWFLDHKKWKRLSVHVPPASGIFKVLLPKWHHFMMSHDGVTSHHRPRFCYHPIQIRRIARKSHFLTWWTYPLTYDLDHRTWPRYGPGWPTRKISFTYIKQFGRENADTHRHMHNSITLNADAGGNKSTSSRQRIEGLKMFVSPLAHALWNAIAVTWCISNSFVYVFLPKCSWVLWKSDQLCDPVSGFVDWHEYDCFTGLILCT